MTTTSSAPTLADTTADTAADIVAIEALVADVERGFNINDADLLVSPFAEDGSAVNVFGTVLAGRAAMLDAARAGLAGPLRDQFARYALTDLVFVRPDVAIGHKHAWATDAHGRHLDVDAGHSMVALYVFVKEGDRWWVAARQNTLVPGPTT